MVRPAPSGRLWAGYGSRGRREARDRPEGKSVPPMGDAHARPSPGPPPASDGTRVILWPAAGMAGRGASKSVSWDAKAGNGAPTMRGNAARAR